MNKREFTKKAMETMDSLTGDYRWIPSRTEMRIEFEYLYDQITKGRIKNLAAIMGAKGGSVSSGAKKQAAKDREARKRDGKAKG